MSRLRIGVALLAVVLLVAGCSDDGDGGGEAQQSGGKSFEFGQGPAGRTRVSVCGAYDVADVKEILGGGSGFRVLAPTAIGKEGDAVTGETCSWQRGTPGKDFLSLQVESRDFGKDAASLTGRMEELQDQTVGATPVADVGDAAFSAVGEDTSLLQVRAGDHFLTFSSSAEGDLEPVPLDTLKFMAGAAIARIEAAS